MSSDASLAIPNTTHVKMKIIYFNNYMADIKFKISKIISLIKKIKEVNFSTKVHLDGIFEKKLQKKNLKIYENTLMCLN